MFSIFKTSSPADLLTSALYNEATFYPKFTQDLGRCDNEAVIECPFITGRRLNTLLPIIKKLRTRNVRVIINTRHSEEHEDDFMITRLQGRTLKVMF